MIQFDVTPDNRPYLEARGKIILNACPGSGKTTAISYKILTLLNECAKGYGNYSGIACLSFTNVAKDEIAYKIESLGGSLIGYPHVISTIDSFINQYITLPFYYLLNRPSKRPTILNTVAFLDEMRLGKFLNIQGRPLQVSYKPSALKIEKDGSFSVAGKTPNPAIVNEEIFKNYAKVYKKWQFDNGYINNDDSTYIAYHLLKKYPEISKSLVKRFPYIIIDEAQDTSEIQYEIFEMLIASGLENIEFVGDPYQSLYEFREARPDLFIRRFEDTVNWQPLRLNHCRRSSQKIVEVYSIFRPSTELPIVSICSHSTDHNLKVLRYDQNNLQSLIARYESLIDVDGSNYILVRGSTHLEQFGIKPSAENPWKSSLAKSLIEAQHQYHSGNSKACIDEVRAFLAEITFPNADHKTKKDEIQKFREDVALNIQLYDFLANMPTTDDTLLNWTTKVTSYVMNKFGIAIDLQLKKKGKAFYALNIRELLYPAVTLPQPVSTIHKVKGKSFNSVLLVLSNNSAGEKISLKDFTVPESLPNEKQRMLYVALSRPEKLVCLAIPHNYTEEEIRTALGLDIEFL